MDLSFLFPGNAQKADLTNLLLRQALIKLDQISSKLDTLSTKLEKIMLDLSDLQGAVTAENTVIDSAIALLNGLKEQLDKAGTDPVLLQQLKDSISAKTQDLANAIVQNTPAA